MLTGPALATGGVVAINRVSLMIVTDAASRLPNFTRVPEFGPVRFSMKFEPVIVTSVPPGSGR